MNDDQATRFAQRMIETWPTGPRRNVWREIALELDGHTARTAYETLARTQSHISVAAFHQAYTASQRRHIEQPTDKCSMCDDTGWVDDPAYHSKRCTRALGCPCHGVKPCRCTRGRQMVETQRRIHEANNR